MGKIGGKVVFLKKLKENTFAPPTHLVERYQQKESINKFIKVFVTVDEREIEEQEHQLKAHSILRKHGCGHGCKVKKSFQKHLWKAYSQFFFTF